MFTTDIAFKSKSKACKLHLEEELNTMSMNAEHVIDIKPITSTSISQNQAQFQLQKELHTQ